MVTLCTEREGYVRMTHMENTVPALKSAVEIQSPTGAFSMPL